jgi:hypothetical protein
VRIARLSCGWFGSAWNVWTLLPVGSDYMICTGAYNDAVPEAGARAPR